MPAFRFCRPDDIPLLVQAINACYCSHFPGMPEYTVASYKQLMREINLWPSSCMIAMAGDDPIGIVFGCKRARSNLIYQIGVHPEYQRQGNATHLLTSLSRKLAVLGPPYLEVELSPDDQLGASLFTRLGYEKKRQYQSFVWEGVAAALPENASIGPVTINELTAQELLIDDSQLSWRRMNETLENCKDDIAGLAIASPEAIEAYLLYRKDSQQTDIVRWYCASAKESPMLFKLLFRTLAAQGIQRVVVPELSPDELPFEILEENGFSATDIREYWVVEAVAG